MDRRKYARSMIAQGLSVISLVMVIVVLLFIPYHRIMGWEYDPFAASWLKRQGMKVFNAIFQLPLSLLFLFLSVGFHYKAKHMRKEARGEIHLKHI